MPPTTNRPERSTASATGATTATQAVAPASSLNVSFDQTVKRLAGEVLPILHGFSEREGDGSSSTSTTTTKQQQDSDAAAADFLARLTTQYISKLVDAALDAHGLLCVDTGAPLRVPPPPFPQHSFPAPPRPLVEAPPRVVIQSSAVVPPGLPPPSKLSKRKMREEYWDDDLPAPKIRQKTAAPPPPPSQVPVQEWVGALGVDLHADALRRAHMPLGLAASTFLWPICHDVYAYGRVRHLQSAKRTSVNAFLQDPALQAMILQEGPPVRIGKRKDAAADNDEEEWDPPSWPNLEELLLPDYGATDLNGGKS